MTRVRLLRGGRVTLPAALREELKLKRATTSRPRWSSRACC